MMKLAAVLAVLSTLAISSAFTPAPFGVRSMRLFSEPAEDEEGLDLNLEEMFDMFDAADKEESFDEALKKVKKDDLGGC